jgi:hypothetical protein
MKNRQILMGILAVVLVFGLVFVGCDQATNGDGQEGKQVIIKIENISDFIANGIGGQIIIFAELPEEPLTQATNITTTAVGYSEVSGGNLSIRLTIPEDNWRETEQPWQGGGEYYVAIFKIEPYQQTPPPKIYYNNGVVAKVSFDSSPVILDFSNFQ